MAKNGTCGPGYATPLDAFHNGTQEKLLYTICVQPDNTKQDYLATIDVNPESSTYSQVIHRTYTGSVGDELHHSGWNVCSSCHGDAALRRDKLVLPTLHSGKVYIVDTGTDPRKPVVHKVIENSEVSKYDVSFLHTTHCLASGEIMISTMGDNEGNGKGDFLLIDGKTLKVKGTWTKGKTAKFGYDFWYQPYHDVMVSTEWGTPKYFRNGCNGADVVNPDRYGRSLNFYKWSTHELVQTVDLGEQGTAPLEIRFLHDPKADQGFVGCAVYSKVFRFFRKQDGTWDTQKAIDIPPKTASKNDEEVKITGLISDILISLDDKYLYVSNWIFGEIRQYNITDTKDPKLVGLVQIGGEIVENGLTLVEDTEFPNSETPAPFKIRGKVLHGAPQMIQLSLDGKRLYVSSSLYSPWDKQIYPQSVKEGTWIAKIDVDIENGGLKVDENFLVHFGDEPDGPVLAHEIRYPGGDCSSDIWLAE